MTDDVKLLYDANHVYREGYDQGQADMAEEQKMMLSGIQFVLEEYSARLGAYARILEDRVEGKNDKSGKDKKRI